MNRITVVFSVCNEEKKLLSGLHSVSWADEIIVVDNQSTDRTLEIATKFGATVFERQNYKMLNINKNFGFDKASNEWILNLDGDEEITEELQKEIAEVINQNGKCNGYWIPRKNIIFGKWIKHGLWWPDKQLRLFRKGKGMFPAVHVHEYVTVEGNTESLRAPIIHHNYESISHFLRKLDTIYTENEVENIHIAGKRLAWYQAVRMPVSDFVKVYFAQEGYKDGLHGLVLAMLQSFYAFIIFAKVWEREKFIETQVTLSDIHNEISKAGKEIYYWEINEQLKHTKNPIIKFLLKLKRKYVANR